VDPEIVAALIGPVLTALLAALAVGFKEWQRRRHTVDQRHETLRQAADEVAFIDARLTAYGPPGPPPGYPTWPEQSYPGPMPSPRRTGARRLPVGRVGYPSVTTAP
jgi:hypothetical protein